MAALDLLKKFNSIRYRILAGFLVITIIYLVYLLSSFNHLSRLDQIRQIDKNVAQVEALTLTMIKKDNDFFDLESINPRFFETRESLLLSERNQLNKRIAYELRHLLESSSEYSQDLPVYIRQTQTSIEDYNEKFEKLVDYVFKRGFKDYGLEGEMRTYAHKLEEEVATTPLTMEDILSLRRHEKDFFLRNETQYVAKFNALAEQLSIKLEESSTTIIGLKNYVRIFNELSKFQSEIGLSSREGLRYELNELTDKITRDYEALLALSEQNLEVRTLNIKLLLLITYIIAAVLSILISIKTSLKLSRPIRKLSNVMSEVVKQRFNNRPRYKLIKPTNEIKQLSASFDELMLEMEVRMKDIQEKTKILRDQNSDLIKLNNELDNFLYSTAHDLRSPLTSLLGLINLSQHENKDQAMIPYFMMMKDSINKMENFIADVVHYAKNNKIELEIEKIDIKSLLNHLINYNKLLTSRDFEFQLDISDEYPLYSDNNRLKIILNNLISNAVKYQDLSKPIRYANIQIHIDRENVKISFTDNGIGIDPEHGERIFDMFYRATELSKGSGLGLYLLREAVRKLNGTVELKSEPSLGSTFIIFIENFTPDKEQQHTISFEDNFIKRV